eukprot:TRINITY_DN7664_c1_g1_i10.p1 TRINITY_DN7664_c1_g1~~TRINITY_DN7664_c1_g1_i10.p1  ORF type:complete len:173 (-),score=25.56 TRINITY_DN7664_c1_g1_i10:292-810(-)
MTGEMMEENADTAARRQLLVPVDDSDDTIRATKWMLENIFREGDVVNFVHVVPSASGSEAWTPGWAGVYEAPYLLASNQEELTEKGLHLVNEKFVPLVQAANCAFRVHILHHGTDPSGIADAITEKATDLNAHAIILAHHKASIIKTWFLGSVCLEIVNRNISTPLVIVRQT